MSKSILIVDDNVNMSSLLSEMLEVFDFQSIQAADGTEALKVLENGDFSMTITDMRMPNMTGMELLAKIKDKYPEMPVVLISGYSVGDDTSGPGGVQPDGFLAKPFMMSDVEELINSLL